MRVDYRYSKIRKYKNHSNASSVDRNAPRGSPMENDFFFDFPTDFQKILNIVDI